MQLGQLSLYAELPGLKPLNIVCQPDVVLIGVVDERLVVNASGMLVKNVKLCLSLLLPSCFIAATLLYNHKISFHAAMVKRPVSKLTKAVQQVTKRERKERTLYLGGRWNNFDLTLAVCKHLHTIGFDKNGFELWTESRDCYLQQGRQLVESPEKIFREGIYYACFWSHGIGNCQGIS